VSDCSTDRPAVGESDLAYRWLGHASVLLDGPPAIAIDPWRWRFENVADAALVTSGHVDHCSEDDLATALRADAPIAAPGHVAERLERTFPGRVIALTEGDDVRLDGARVVALPAEGPTRDERASGFLPRGSALAYLVETPQVRALILGDSCVLPEHEGWKPDVAFVAIGGLVTATPDEASKSAARLGAGAVVPVHWGDLEARYDAAVHFVDLCSELGVDATLARPAGNGRERLPSG
jgi:L-ascorbate metabolism protein UlaG (beta-lactamase superfamily)